MSDGGSVSRPHGPCLDVFMGPSSNRCHESCIVALWLLVCCYETAVHVGVYDAMVG
jgi:hypothetical protein